jgi:RNA-directed DNA polymerase
MMHGREKSDPAIVATKPANKAGKPAAEPVERRAGTKGNADQRSTRRAQDRESVSQALGRIRQAAKRRTTDKFTALFHHISPALLRLAFSELKRNAAPGVDGLTWRTYEADLDQNLAALHDKVHRGAYRAQPSRRQYIPKPDGRQRPLAVAALEDKIVQRATVAVLNAIYEEEFLGFSYGFRPKRGQHDALDALDVGINSTKVNYILDADIAGFFDAVDQTWLVRFLDHRIGDPRIIRLIQKWLQAGVLEDGEVRVSDRGTGQGSVASPLLANVYLHYAFDLWAERWRRHEATGDVIIVRYADDIVVGFEHEDDARRFWDAMRARLQEFSLSLHPEKTRLIAFGRRVAADRARRGLNKPETFNFLGFTFICGKSRWGKFLLMRKTRRDRMRAKPQARGLAGAGRDRLLQLSRSADQLSVTVCFPRPRGRSLATLAPATQSAGQNQVGADHEACRRLAPKAANPASLAARSLRRQTPKVGAVCGNPARTVLCGGRSEMSVPTAIGSGG